MPISPHLFESVQPLPPDVQRMLVINQDDPFGEMEDHVVNYTRFGILYAQAMGDRERARFARDRAWARAFTQAREQLVRDGIAKPTEAMITNLAELDPAYITATDARAQAEEDLGALEILKNALELRGKMLLTLGGAERRAREQAGV